MHEYSVVSALLSEVEAALPHRRARVKRVYVAVGELAGLDCTLFNEAFSAFRSGGPCAEAELRIRHVAARWACSQCQVSASGAARLACPVCAQPARLVAGQELVLERMEMEVPDV